MDIRRYFGGAPSKPKASNTKESVSKKDGSKVTTTGGKGNDKLSRKRPLVVIASDSDDEEPIPKRPIARQERKRSSFIIEDSDDDVPPSPPAKTKTTVKTKDQRPDKPASKTKEVKPDKPAAKVSPSDFFGSAPAHRSSRPVTQPSKETAVPSSKIISKKAAIQDAKFEIHDDDDFVQTLRALDNDAPSEIRETKNKGSSVTPVKDTSNRSTNKSSKSNDSGRDNVAAGKRPLSSTPPERPPSAAKTPKAAVLKKSSSSSGTPKGSGTKKAGGNSAAYISYLNREGPTAPGSKEVPEGEDDCFEGLTFVITGVMESLERTEMDDLIKKYGGRVTSSLSAKTSYIIVGRDAGVSKLSKADKLKTKRLTEDSFLDLIRTRPGKKSPNKQQSTNGPTASTATHSAESASKKSRYFEEARGSSMKEEPCGLNGAAQKSSSLSRTPDRERSQNDIKQTSIPKTELASTAPSPTSMALSSDAKSSGSPHGDGGGDPGQSLLWVDKYRPKSTKQIIGQQGDASNVAKLRSWLDKWHTNHSGGSAGKAKPKGKYGAQSSAIFKAALLSGPPGVGKTTTAQLVCKEAGFTFVELNASDTRSKKSLQEIVAQMVGNTSLAQYIEGNVKGAQNHCLLMDEVDGMSGNEDRGGVAELIQLIKSSKIPVICMCNDRNHQKIRSLSNHCYDLRFARPGVPQLKAAMLSVCFKEKLTINAQAIEEIVMGAGQDVRQILHNMSMWSVNDKSLSVAKATAEAKNSKKDTKKSIFDVTRAVFSASEHKTMSINDRSDLFFTDYQMAPLFVQDNYLRTRPELAPINSAKHMDLVSQAADSLCSGDLAEKLIRSEQQWGLLPLQAMFSSVIPGCFLAGEMGFPMFPSFLGRNSTARKNDRLIQEIHLHARLRVSCNKNDLNCDYLPFLCKAIMHPLVSRGAEGVQQTLRMMNEYCLAREDMNSVVDLTLWPEQESPMSRISSQVKAAFTRAYNSDSHQNPYSTSTTVTKRSGKGGGGDLSQDGLDVDDEASEEEEDTEDLTKDAMIKVKKTAAPKKKVKKDPEPSTSKKGAASRKKK